MMYWKAFSFLEALISQHLNNASLTPRFGSWLPHMAPYALHLRRGSNKFALFLKRWSYRNSLAAFPNSLSQPPLKKKKKTISLPFKCWKVVLFEKFYAEIESTLHWAQYTAQVFFVKPQTSISLNEILINSAIYLAFGFKTFVT